VVNVGHGMGEVGRGLCTVTVEYAVDTLPYAAVIRPKMSEAAFD
jgi:hypothetical protein